MKVFAFDPFELRPKYEAQGWLHIPSGLTQEFLEYALAHVAEVQEADALAGEAIAGAKTQFVFEFPEDMDLGAQVHDVVASLTGMRPSETVLSERHVKAYLPDADPLPLAHKDRFASQVSVGLTLRVGQDSHVVLWPSHERDVNPHLTTGLRDSLLPEQAPERLLDDSTAVMLHDAPGDVLVFPGSSTWHLRRNSASTTLVYLKFNDFGSDPLAEDPTSGQRREQTRRRLGGSDLSGAVPVLSRGFDTVAHETGRGREVWAVNCWEHGERHTRSVPAAWVQVLEQIGDGHRLDELVVPGLSEDQVRVAVRGLAERGAVDLIG